MNEIEIISYDEKYYDKIIEFNKLFYKRTDIEKYFRFRFFEHPYSKNEKPYTILGINEKDEIVGQSLHVPMKLGINKKILNGYWGVNLVVAPSERGKGTGQKIVIENKNIPHSFIFGITPISLKILEQNGFTILDNFNRFLYLPSFFSVLGLFLSPKSKIDLDPPETISTSNHLFKLQRTCPKIPLECWNDEVMEFLRDYDYLHWRFFTTYNHFYFYYNEDSKNPVYFVLKKLYWRNHCFISLVDLRLKLNDNDAIKDVISACKIIRKKTKSIGIVAGSSHINLYKEFRKSGFFEFGIPSTLVNCSDLGDNYPKMEQKGVFLNMADSDFEEAYQIKGNLHRRVIKSFFRKPKVVKLT